ncbi:ATP-binding protein [Rhodocytophaga rosea]|uniref:ATP-binding protein n=1 Tax=Rhodocytophaga rosea TaxID=2704465 RepID=A0A6C0GTY3_9BACT|nr:ATP-binding protein [Rhodocytophaga rosea]QHT71013.1 ATP-binding protein [Rhodocytophaga rosea]
MHLILFIGIPGSGKSTFYFQHFFHTHMRVNLDMLRTRNRENRLLEFCFQTQMPLVVDNTNVQLEERKKYIDAAKQHKFKVSGYYFESSLQASLERNAKRTGKQQVSEKGLKAKYYQLQIPEKTEGFDELFYVRVQDNFTFDISPWKDEV